MPDGRVVSVVDDDESVRESLPEFLASFGFQVRAFASGHAFLLSDCVNSTGCLVLDVAMPHMSGPELRQELARRGHDIPAVFITAQPPDQVRAIASGPGVVAWLFKPFTDTAILEAVNTALGRAAS